MGLSLLMVKHDASWRYAAVLIRLSQPQMVASYLSIHFLAHSLGR